MNVGTLAAWIELHTKGFAAGLAKAKAGLSSLKKDIDSSARNVRTLGDAMGSMLAPTAIFGLAGSAVALLAAVKPAVGAAWLLPAPIAAITAVSMTAKAGLIGMGDAMKAIAKGDAKKLAEAMKDMAPAGKAFVQTLSNLKTRFDDVRRSVQQKLFAGLDTELSALANNYLPVAEQGMGRVATSLNGMAKASSAVMNTPFMQGVAAQVFATTAGAVDSFTPAVGALLTALGNTVKVGLPFIAQFSTWAGKALAAKAAFYGTADGAAMMNSKIQAGIAVLQQLGRIGGNILTGLNNLMMGSSLAGTSLLGTIENLTAKFAAWSSTAEGQQQINDLMLAAVSIFKSLAVILPVFAGVISTIATAFASLPAPVQSVLASFLVWGGVIGLVVSRFAPLISLLGRLGPMLIGAAARWGLMGAAARTAATATGSSVGSILGAVGRSLVTGLGGMLAKIPGLFARIGPALAQVGAKVGPMLLRGLATLAPRLIPIILQAIAAVGRFIPGIGWVVSGIATVVGLIISNWDAVKAGTIAAWNAVIAFIQTLPARIGAFFSGLGATIASGAAAAWNWLTTTVSTAVSSAISFLLGLPAKVGYALGYLAGMVYSGAIAAWNWLWNTLPGIIAQVGTWLASLPGIVWGWLTGLASTVAAGAVAAWRWLYDHAVTWGGQALDWIGQLPGKVGGFLASLPGIVGNAATAAWTAFKTNVVNLGTQALTWIQQLPGKIKGFFSGAASWLVASGAAILEGLWNGLKSKAQAVLDWISNIGRQIAAGFNAAVSVRSPSRVFDESGVNIMRGLLNGLRSLAPTILSWITRHGTALTSAFDASYKTGGLAGGLQGLASTAGQLLRGDMAAAGGGSGTTIVINNPTAERASDSISRAARVNALLGAF